MLSKVSYLVALCLVVGTLETVGHQALSYDKSEEPHRRFTRQIAPGTKFCGNGNRTHPDARYGFFEDTDQCCEEHDNCDRGIPGKGTAYGLYNPEPFTRSHCDCDRKFYHCLAKSSTRVSRVIKEIFFTILTKKCFQEKPCPPGETCDTVEYEFVDEYGWRTSWDKTLNMFTSIGLMREMPETGRYDGLYTPILMPWFCL